MAKYIKSWGPVIAWALVIFTFSSIPTLPTAEIYWWDFIIKKSAHMIEFGILYFLLVRAFGSHSKKYLLSFIISLLYALSDEYHQSFVPGRTPHIRDVGFDTLGTIITYYELRHEILLKKFKKN